MPTPISRSTSSFAGCPSKNELARFKVIVSTFVSSAMLEAQGLLPGHFTHIFLDEAGQATEPETMIPIANFATPDTVVVLAGDHFQLGPLIRSGLARGFGLEVSFMQRVVSLAAASSGKVSSHLLTKLVKNYRSHPKILRLPSGIFYEGELVPCGGEFASARRCQDSGLNLSSIVFSRDAPGALI